LIYIIIALAFSLFFFSPVKIHIKIKKSNNDEHAELMFNYLNLVKVYLLIPEMVFQIKNFTPFLSLKFKLSPISKKSKKAILSHRRINFKQVKYFIELLEHQVKKFNRSFHWLLKRVKILKFHLYLSFGRDNPEIVAIAVGTLWSAIHLIMSKMSYIVDFSKAKINISITPDFINNESLKLQLEGIFQIKLGHIIIVSLVLPLLWIFSKKSHIKNTEGAANYG